MKLKAIGLFVKNMKVITDFYQEAMGLQVKWDGKDVSVIDANGDVRFMLYARKDFEIMSNQAYEYPKGMNGTFELGFDVNSYEEVDAFYKLVLSKGATSICEPKTYPWKERSCFVADPEGNIIEIATWLHQSE